MGYYDQMKRFRDTINKALLPSGARVTYVGQVLGGLNAIWYFGKNETGFAAGATPEAVVESIFDKVFGGL